MYGAASFSETALAETRDLGIPIIPEVMDEGKTLILVVEVTAIKPGES